MNNWYHIKNNQPHTDVLEIYIDNEIGEGGIPARSFLNELKAHAGKPIKLHINSPGGSLIDAFAIYDFVKLQGYPITAYISGIAASAATVVSAAAKETFIGEHSYFFIHNPYYDGKRKGPKGDLEKMKNDLLDIYHKKTGMDKDQLSRMMDEETLLNAHEALEMGFVDGLVREAKVAARKQFLKGISKLRTSYKVLQTNKLGDTTFSDNISNGLLEKLQGLSWWIKNAMAGTDPSELDFISLILEDGSEVYALPTEPGAIDIAEGDKVLTEANTDGLALDDGTYILDDETQITLENGIIVNIINPIDMKNAVELEAKLDELLQQLQALLDKLSGGEPEAPEQKKEMEEKEKTIENLHYELAKVRARRVETRQQEGDKAPDQQEAANQKGWNYVSNYLQNRFG